MKQYLIPKDNIHLGKNYLLEKLIHFSFLSHFVYAANSARAGEVKRALPNWKILVIAYSFVNGVCGVININFPFDKKSIQL